MPVLQIVAATLSAWPKAPATSTSELLNDPGFDNPSVWTYGSNWVVTGSQAVNSGGTAPIYQSVNLLANTVYNIIVEVASKSMSGGGLGFNFINAENGAGTQGAYLKLNEGTNTLQFTPTANMTRLFSIQGNGGTGNVTSVSMKLA
jgi:hypothetical protein